jgi:hypothetical protein
MKYEFTPDVEGFKHAKAWLIRNNLYNRYLDRMDGYSLVFYANDKYRKKKK